MANLDLKYKINIPFAEQGNRDDIPDTSPDGLVNNTDGLGVKYELEIPAGGEYFERQTFNGILYKVYAAVKELQDLALEAGFPVDMTKAINILDAEHGGISQNNLNNIRNYFSVCDDKKFFPFYTGTDMKFKDWLDRVIDKYPNTLFGVRLDSRSLQNVPSVNMSAIIQTAGSNIGYLLVIAKRYNGEEFSYSYEYDKWTKIRNSDGTIPGSTIPQNSITSNQIINIVASKVTGLSKVATSANYNDLDNKPNLATVALSGSYNDLNNRPNLTKYFPNIIKCVSLKNPFVGTAEVGTVVFFGEGITTGSVYLPEGGTWFVIRIPKGTVNNMIPSIEAGGSILTPIGNFERFGYAVRIR